MTTDQYSNTPHPYLGIAWAQAGNKLAGYFRRVVNSEELLQVAAHYRQFPCPATNEVLREIVSELQHRLAPPRPRTGNSPIDRLRSINITALASRYTDLFSTGPGRLKGCCPLHQDRTASFYIYEDSQRWQCFGGCATNGDVVDLVARLSGCRGAGLARWAEQQGLIAPLTGRQERGTHRKHFVTNWEVRARVG
ncbi:MAG: CHC2 zinc finger domain-containing protein [Dehalococcoidia bacterium]